MKTKKKIKKNEKMKKENIFPKNPKNWKFIKDKKKSIYKIIHLQVLHLNLQQQ
jgi:hypothetical protein